MTFSKVGVSGSRKGLTPLQERSVRHFLAMRGQTLRELHHGDCTGADVEIAQMVRDTIPSARIVGHPCNMPWARARFASDVEFKPLAPIRRNHRIVDSVDWMFILPSTHIERLRSGTWATFRYTVYRRRPHVLVYPDGSVVCETYGAR